MRDPVILINYANNNHDNLSIPITSKPLPALLAPPPTLHRDGSLSSFASSVSSSSAVTATSRQQQHHHERSNSNSSQYYHIEEHAYLQQQPNNVSYFTIIQRQSQEIQDLRQDLIKLNQKYIDQIDRIQTAEQAQFQVESELEDLSSRLFEQANEMVAQEKKARFYAEKKVSQLERELKRVYEELDNERAQLKELKAKLTSGAETAAVERDAHLLHPLAISTTIPEEDEQQSHNNKIMTLTPPLDSLSSNNIYLDDGWLSLFKEFLALAPDFPLESIHRLPFLKHCLELDIEPCLRFGNKSSRLSMKKVLDAVIRQPCFIESDTPRKRHSHDDRMSAPKQTVVRRSSFAIFRTKSTASTSTSTATEEPQHQCYGCSKSSAATSGLFRFKLKETDKEWFWIDRSCRDRLVAVCDFYVFIRHVRQGLQSQRTISSLFQECVWLRLVMFWARSGVHHLIK